MLLVIDIGNTHTVSGIFQNQKIFCQWRIQTQSGITADELGIIFNNLLTIHRINPASISGVIISSVVPRLDSTYAACFRTFFPAVPDNSMIVVDNEKVTNLIDIRLDNPTEIGADRIVNGIGAFVRFKHSVIVIDFGTAITFDCISEKGEYLGGLILPGLHTALEALINKAAKLPQIDIMTPPEETIGTNTVLAMKSGIIYGYGAMIEGLIARVRKEMTGNSQTEPSVIATGGMASVIRPYAPSIQYADPHLTLNGLAYIYSQLV